MTNLGIVIAVSDYLGDTGSLPACRRDGAAIVEVLGSAGKFHDILYIEQDTNSTTVKQKLAEFIKNYSEKDIGEVVFYFTGHGEFFGQDFYYLLTDYQQRRRKQTALQNSELDNFIRALRPKLFVKIVDACHSGVTYIKNSDEISEYFKSSKSNFEKLYFLFSSQTDQFSYQDDRISYFTESILKAVANHKTQAIRYNDIIDYVSDEFETLDFQTPLFVTQADFTELFCDVTESLSVRPERSCAV
jgi:hypothetical protein